MWYGSLLDIPEGWALCNGENGTPDLRDRFIAAAGNTYSVSDTGGLVQHNHAFTGDGHMHFFQADTGAQYDFNYESYTPQDAASGDTDNAALATPYHALAYIMVL